MSSSTSDAASARRGPERREIAALVERGPTLWEIPATTRTDMRVPAYLIADRDLVGNLRDDLALWQLANVTTLPGITGVVAMPDVHQGYGFPVGTVAASVLPDGAISPGGVGYDINCGVRLLTLGLAAAELGTARAQLMNAIARTVPTGTGRGGPLRLDRAALLGVLRQGAPAVVAMGLGRLEDLAHTESGGHLAGADPAEVSERARLRGADQLGTLGAGNHFLELQVVERLVDAQAAAAFGLREGELCVLIHTGSRGLGHQVCTDHLRIMERRRIARGEHLVDRQLACAPADSPEGAAYLGAMACAANFAWANRQVIAHRVRSAVTSVLGPARGAEVRQVYDVAHNIAKPETHDGRSLLVHRKGATRAFGPARADQLPADHAAIGQAVFVPGSMGTASWVLRGRDAAPGLAFGSACHGAGRQMSRTESKRRVAGQALRGELARRDILVLCRSDAELAEEAPSAYRDVDAVVDIVDRAGLAGRVARLTPLAVLKG
jgi:tRNA-splicing ligase RtcB (3'-phosphate/5'-hydroxy nucleic acid ligase)